MHTLSSYASKHSSLDFHEARTQLSDSCQSFNENSRDYIPYSVLPSFHSMPRKFQAAAFRWCSAAFSVAFIWQYPIHSHAVCNYGFYKPISVNNCLIFLAKLPTNRLSTHIPHIQLKHDCTLLGVYVKFQQLLTFELKLWLWAISQRNIVRLHISDISNTLHCM